MRVFLDANLLFSASPEDSLARRFLDVLTERTTVLTHPAVWEEAERNVRAKRPHWLQGLEAVKALVAFGTGVAPCPDVGLPPKDRPVLGAAIAAKADRLVTGDLTHFGPLFKTTIQGVTVVSPRMMAEELAAMGRDA
jgi:predicted nucleic acid-binding protein